MGDAMAGPLEDRRWLCVDVDGVPTRRRRARASLDPKHLLPSGAWARGAMPFFYLSGSDRYNDPFGDRAALERLNLKLIGSGYSSPTIDRKLPP
jgi:hypothetical protein